MPEKKDLNVLIGTNIRQAREAAGYTQERFSEMIGIDTGVSFEKLLETARFLKENVPANYSGHQMNIAPKQCVMG